MTVMIANCDMSSSIYFSAGTAGSGAGLMGAPALLGLLPQGGLLQASKAEPFLFVSKEAFLLQRVHVLVFQYYRTKVLDSNDHVIMKLFSTITLFLFLFRFPCSC